MIGWCRAGGASTLAVLALAPWFVVIIVVVALVYGRISCLVVTTIIAVEFEFYPFVFLVYEH